MFLLALLVPLLTTATYDYRDGHPATARPSSPASSARSAQKAAQKAGSVWLFLSRVVARSEALTRLVGQNLDRAEMVLVEIARAGRPADRLEAGGDPRRAVGETASERLFGSPIWIDISMLL
jgi:hypothetical protein